MSGIALVTGTSSGIGLATAIHLARAGFQVVATMRDPAKAEKLQAAAEVAQVAVEVRQLDVQDQASVSRCIGEVLAAHGRIDLLVNNAGAGYVGTCEDTPFADLQRVMDLNFFGVWRVTQAALPILRGQGYGRIVTVTSIGGLLGQPFNDAYCAAKFAVEGWMESLAPVAARLGIQVALVEPGPVNTEFVSTVIRDVQQSGRAPGAAYAPMLEQYLAATRAAFATAGQTPDDVARVIVEAATADPPHFRYVTSETVHGLVARKYVDPTGDATVDVAGRRLGH